MSINRTERKIYIFDTSAFVALSRTGEYVIRIPDSLWQYLETMMKSGQVISHKLVFDEISSNRKNPDFITKWVKDKEKFFLPKTDAQKMKIPEIVRNFPKLIDPGNEKEQADPWLIALAMEKSQEENLFEISASIVVSQENTTSSVKIPAACKYFGVSNCSLREFFDEIGLSTGLIKND